MTVLATICARGGSKGVPGKNLALVGGQSMLERAVAQAQAASSVDAVVVSSDDVAILEAAEGLRVDLLVDRPSQLATDKAAKLPVIRHAVEAWEASTSTVDVVVDLDVTVPLRHPQDIDAVVDLVTKEGAQTALTVMEAGRSPYFNQVVRRDGEVALPCAGPSVATRQAGPAVYDLTGLAYAWTRERLFEDGPLVRPDARLHVVPRARGWDVDDELDLTVVRAIASSDILAASRPERAE